MRNSSLSIANVCLASLAFATWWSGTASIIISIDHLHVGIIIGILILWSEYYAYKGKWETVSWIADLMPPIALVGTVLGALLAVHNVDIGALPQDKLRVEVIYSLIATGYGIAGFVILTVLERVSRSPGG